MQLLQTLFAWAACGTLSALLLLCLAGRLKAHPPSPRAMRGVPAAALVALLALAAAVGSRAVPKSRAPARGGTRSVASAGESLRFTSIAVSSNSVSLEVAWPTNLFTSGATLDLFRACACTGRWEWVDYAAAAATATCHLFSVSRASAAANGFFRVSDRGSCAVTMADADGDGLPDVYELANGMNPYVPDYVLAPKILAGAEGGAPTLAAALAGSVPYSIVEIAPGVHEGSGWEGVRLPAHPVLITSPDGGRSRACTLRSRASPATFFLDATQRTETVVQGLNIDLLAPSGVVQTAFWCGGNLPWAGLPAAGTFRNLSIRMPNPGVDYRAWFFRHWESNEVVIASCVVNAAGATCARGIAAVDSPPMSVENCTFVNFPPEAEQSHGYGIQYESTAQNWGGAPERIPVEIVNCVFDQSFTNALALAPLESGADYDVTMMNCIVPSPLEHGPDAAFDVCVTNAFVSWGGHLLAGSPAIDFGAEALRSPFDVDGQDRSGRPDAGADERIATGARDADGDGLPDADEIDLHGTDPFRADSDFDGVPDGDEAAMGTDPRDPASYRQTISVAVTNTVSTGIASYVAWGFSSEGWETNGLAAFPSGSGGVAYTNDAVLGVACVKAFSDVNGNGAYDEGVDVMLARGVAQARSADVAFAFGDVDGDGASDAQERADGTDPHDAGNFRLACTVNLLPCGRSAWLTNYMAWGHSSGGWETNGLAAFSSVTNYEFAVDAVATNGALWAKVFRDLDTNGVYNVGVDALTVMRLSYADNGGRVDLRFGDRNGNGLPDWWEARTGLDAEGAARRAWDDPDGDGLVNLHEYWMGADPLVPDGSNTLLSVAARSIDDRIAGVDPAAAVPRFVDYMPNASNGVFVANTNFWARDLDLSCVSVWNSSDVPESKTATLITRKHVVLSEHWWNYAGGYTFCDANGLVCMRHLVDSRQISDDLRLGRLNEPLPASFRPASIVTTNFTSRLAYGKYLPTLCINHAKAATVLELVSLDCETTDDRGRYHLHYGNTSWTNCVSNQRRVIRDSTPDGFSSSPVFIVAGDDLILLFTKHLGTRDKEAWWRSWGPMLPFGLDAIQNRINEWEGENAHLYQITPFDLAAYPETVNH